MSNKIIIITPQVRASQKGLFLEPTTGSAIIAVYGPLAQLAEQETLNL